RIAQRLAGFGVSFIEGGWPGSNPKDAEFFARAKDTDFGDTVIAAFGSTCRAKTDPANDPQLAALLEAGTEVVTIFGKTSPLHVNDVLRVSREENLRMIAASVA